MAALRVASPSTRCSACQRSILSAFVTPLPSSHASRRAPPRTDRTSTARSLTTNTAQRSDVIHQEEQNHVPPPPPLNGEQLHTDQADTTNALPDLKAGTTKPWYLQIADAQKHQLDAETSNPFAARQKLPPLPPNPPPLLPALLNHLSITIGLDYLSIVDLRQVDPPPAFGANLLMLFGTARSEKHLNVSADRLCRWLRTEHKLTPYADGLLGRNELKLKLKRKNRRSKMMSTAGARSDLEGAIDDGTRTGWVCVNVGGVDAGEASVVSGEQEIDDGQRQGFVGFGRRSEGAKIVIQMLTEEKRVELDLENLWQGVLSRSIKRKKAEASAEDVEDDDSQRPMLVSSDQDARRRFFMAGLERREQVRGFHSSARRRLADDLTTDERLQQSSEDLDETVAALLAAYDTSSPTQTEPAQALPSDPDAEAATTLETYLARLKSLPEHHARAALGTGHEDKTSTPFLRAFHSSMPLFPSEAHYVTHLNLHAHALHIQHQGYNKTALYDLLLDMEVSCPTVPPEAFNIVLDAILKAPHTLPPPLTESNPTLHPSPFPSKQHSPAVPQSFIDETTTSTDLLPLTPDTSYENPPPQTGHTAVLHTVNLALSVIERLPAHNLPPLPPTFLAELNNAISFPLFPSTSPLTLPPKARAHLQHHLRQSINLLYSSPSLKTPRTFIPGPIPPDLIISLLESHARTENHAGFWRLWRDMALRMQRRNEEMYAVMFEGVAREGKADLAGRVVGEWVGEMGREGISAGGGGRGGGRGWEVEGDGEAVGGEHGGSEEGAEESGPVIMDARIAKAVRACLRVAGTESGEVWERCGRVLARAEEGRDQEKKKERGGIGHEEGDGGD